MTLCASCGNHPGPGEHCPLCHRTAEYFDPPEPDFYGYPPRERRRALGLSAREVARKIGVGEDSIFRWERGDGKPSAKNNRAWERILDAEEKEADQDLLQRQGR